MWKRLAVMVVGAGVGSLAGLLIEVFGGGNLGLFLGAGVGAVLPLLILGPPGGKTAVEPVSSQRKH
jgi:hypothetical protein